jgi:glycosyltransferase involved in cell wall biosynthesis
MVGRFVDQKDHSLLLRAFARIQSPARLRFAGDGPLRHALESEVSQLGLRDRVEFLGPRLDIAQLLAQSHVFALATKWEGFPLSILEAMRAGLPVIASNAGGVSEAVSDGQTGYVVEPGDVESFRERLEALAGNPVLRQKLGDAGRQRYQADFTVEPMLQKLLTVYQMAVLGIRTPHTFMLPASHLPDPRVHAARG